MQLEEPGSLKSTANRAAQQNDIAVLSQVFTEKASRLETQEGFLCCRLNTEFYVEKPLSLV